ncbi:FAD:protein FMN transferase [uncultured Friedmanniella sp.]|uniref:FAD:protein FMN transferase n=1 Tax=uncultured Friedmanniella sp. TaxID=335381 RepID=UPI0035CBFAB6
MSQVADRVARFVVQTMGMPVSLALRGRHAATAEGRQAWDRVVAELAEVDRVFSTYRSDSWVSRLGRGDVSLDACPPEVAEVLALGDQAERESDGAFAVRRPDADGRLALDPTGVVKGWAVERAATQLDQLPDTDYSLSAGGDLTCRLRTVDGAPWRVGIENPLDPDRLVAVVPVTNGAVATSGTSRRGGHLVDARTGRAPTGVASVTVLAPSLTWADIDATAAYAHGLDAARWLGTRTGRRGLVVWADGTTTLVEAAAS